MCGHSKLLNMIWFRILSGVPEHFNNYSHLVIFSIEFPQFFHTESLKTVLNFHTESASQIAMNSTLLISGRFGD